MQMRRKNTSAIESIKERVKGSIRLIGVLVTVVLLVSLLGNIVSIRQAHDRIVDAENRVEELRSEHEELEKQLEFVESEQYAESQLRDKLGMAKEGEIIVVMPSDDLLRKLAPNYVIEEPQLPDPTWKKWLNLFI